MITREQYLVLVKYAHTSDGRYMQALPGATELWRPLGLLEFRGESWGTRFYSITELGRSALSDWENTP